MPCEFCADFLHPTQGNRQQPHQFTQRVRPKVPHGAQRLGNGTEEDHRTACRPQYHEAPQLPLAPAQQEKEGRGAHAQAVDCVQQSGETGPPYPERPQQIVQHPGCRAQQDRLSKDQHLLGDLVSHHPNRRLKKPLRP